MEVLHDVPTMMDTYSGRLIDAVNIRPEDIDWEDVAHALANTCRYGGHCMRFYSVAAHSIHCHDEAVRRRFSRLGCLASLIHDAGEAYWHDLGRPLKAAANMSSYNAYLDAVQAAAEKAVGVEGYVVDCEWVIKEIDNAVLKAEVLRIMKSRGKGWRGFDDIEAAPISWWRWMWYNIPGRAKAGFLARLRRYV